MAPYYVVSQPGSKAGTKMKTQDMLETKKSDLFTKIYKNNQQITNKAYQQVSLGETISPTQREREKLQGGF